MLLEERRRRILELLEKRETVTVEELVDQFKVSSVTVRADLEAMSDAGLLVRSHGGALRKLDAAQDLPVRVKEQIRHGEKVRIARRALELIRDHETVILDSGSTTLEIARALRDRDRELQGLNVITNALDIAYELARLPKVRVIMLGGLLRHVSLSLVGPHAEQALRGLNADRAFIGVDGLDLEVGLTTPDVLEAQVTTMMIQAAREVVVVADSSKFGRRSLSVIGRVERIHKIITDDGIDSKLKAGLETAGVDVLTC
jgi:DeoR family transcriptional regulator of aga operon